MKLYKVMQIDDNDSDNFFHQMTLEDMEEVTEVLLETSPERVQASLIAGELRDVDIFFLDINMPGMNGFDFLDSLPPKVLGHSKLIVLSSSLNPTDKGRMASYNEVAGYITKPLTETNVREFLRSLQMEDG